MVDEQEVDRKLGGDRVRRKGSEDEEEQGEDISKYIVYMHGILKD